MFTGGRAARQRFQILQRVAHIVFHVGWGRLVHERQQTRADVVVQVLRTALALFAAATLDRQVIGHRAAQLFDHAVGQPCVFSCKQALAAARIAQHQCAALKGRDVAAGREHRRKHGHQQQCATTGHTRLRHRLQRTLHFQRLEKVAQQRGQLLRVALRVRLHFARGAVELLEDAFGGERMAGQQTVKEPLARRGIQPQRDEHHHRQ